MRILIDNSTGYCLGVGDDNSWLTLNNATQKPDFIDDQFWLWRYNLTTDVNLQSSWVKESLPTLQPFERVISDKNFCDELLKLIFQQNQALTTAERISLVNIIQSGLNALSWGDAEVARAAFLSISLVGLWTQSRKDWIIAQIDNYLNILNQNN